MKNKWQGISLVLMGVATFSLASLAFASVNITPPSTGNIAAGTGLIGSTSDVASLFCGIINWLFWGLIVLSIVMFLIGGYKYATSGGDPEKVRGATRTLTFAAISIVVALVAAGVPYLVGSFLQSNSSSLSACSSSGSGSGGSSPIITSFDISGPQG